MRRDLDLFRGFNNLMDDRFMPARQRQQFGDMKLDIKEEDNQYLVNVDVPGLEKEDINIALDKGVLTISAKKDAETSKEENGYVCKERFYGSMSRSVVVGDDVTKDDIKASLDKGVLTLAIAKKEKKEPEANLIEIE